MKNLILTMTMTLVIIGANAQGFKVKHAAQSTDGDINLLLGKPASTNTSNIYQNSNNTESYNLFEEEEKSITLKNASYSAKTVDLYVKENGEWLYLQTTRIPGGSEVSYLIGEYEYSSMYGYIVHPVNEYSTVSTFYSDTATLY